MQITASHIGTVAQSLGPLLAMFALIFTIRSGIQNKRAVIMMECHRRSEALLILRHDLLKRMFAAGDRSADAFLRSDIQAWVQRFWSLQFDQYEFWRRGFIDDAFFRYWMLTRHRDFRNSDVGGRLLWMAGEKFDELIETLAVDHVTLSIASDALAPLYNLQALLEGTMASTATTVAGCSPAPP